MRVYRIKPGPAGTVDVFGHVEGSLAGVDCPVCTQWGGGFRYPTIGCAEVAALGEDVGKFLELGKVDFRRKGPDPMTVDEYASVRDMLKPLLGPDRPVMPGTSFGPLKGELRGPVNDFTWGLLSSVFLRESVFEEIRRAGFPLAGARADLTFKTFRGRRWFGHEGPGEPLVELEVPPTARLAPSVEHQRCDVCGRPQVRRRKIVDRTSFDESKPIQCLYEHRPLVVVNEALGQFIRARKYSGVTVTVQDSE
ncbi:MAG: double-CXXCG motif protein [Kiloniellales bacterium]|nr:double-CXXCG motif protein [Kiloniellales bacterium]